MPDKTSDTNPMPKVQAMGIENPEFNEDAAIEDDPNDPMPPGFGEMTILEALAYAQKKYGHEIPLPEGLLPETVDPSKTASVPAQKTTTVATAQAAAAQPATGAGQGKPETHADDRTHDDGWGKEELKANPEGDASMLASLVKGLGKKTSIGDLRRALSLISGALCFRDQRRDHYIEILEKEQRRMFQLDSPAFQHYYADCYFQRHQSAMTETVRLQSLRILHGRARRGPLLPLSVRVADEKEGLLLDFADDYGHLAVIETRGWYLSRRGRPQFLQPEHELPLPRPLGGRRELTNPEAPPSAAPVYRQYKGDLQEGLEVLRELLPALDELDWQMLLAWMTGCLHPGLMMPMLCLTGSQGCGKTTLARIVRRLIDPSTADVMALPQESEMARILQEHAMPIFDNIGRLRPEQANMLCRSVTGVARAKVRPGTAPARLRRPMILTALEAPCSAPDWLDRALLLEMKPMDDRRREPDSAIWQALELVHPVILAALLDLTSAALAHTGKIKAERFPRMADYAAWGMAVSAARGLPEGQFLICLQRNTGRQFDAELEACPLAQTILTLMEGRNESWRGNMAEFLAIVPAPLRPFRTSAGRKLRALMPLLAHYGLGIEFQRQKHGGQRTLCFSRRAE